MLPPLRPSGQYRAMATDANPLLRRFGERVRALRREAGWSLSELARRSGLSRRYATETEAGRANPSLLKLAQLADALGVGLCELLDLAPHPRRGERIALVGLRGAGKTTVGRLLARRLEVPFVELDRRVEELAGMDLAGLFDLHGEARFRELEAEALEEVLAEGSRLVLEVGGSLVVSERTWKRLRETCRTVWLRASADEHFQRVLSQGDRRPMRGRPRAREELRELLARREPLYAQAEIMVETTGLAPDRIADTVLERLGLAEAPERG